VLWFVLVLVALAARLAAAVAADFVAVPAAPGELAGWVRLAWFTSPH